MHKSKITKLFDWNAYQTAVTQQNENPDDKTAAKKLQELSKELKQFRAKVSKDLKLGLTALQEDLAQNGKKGSLPYSLHLDYFAADGGGSLLILGKQTDLKKEFKAAWATKEKVNISLGVVSLDNNDILRFEPAKNGMKVKAKPIVNALKQDPIKKSKPGFWSKRKVNNVIIGAEAVASATKGKITGDSSLVDEKVTYTEKGTNSEVYDIFKSFVNKDYVNSNGTRNAEYFSTTLQKVDTWVQELQTEFKAKKDPKLKAAYGKMGKMMLAFKKRVQKDSNSDKAQHINEDSALAAFEQVFDREMAQYETETDAYQKSILKGKLERVLLELDQKINGDSTQTAAIALKEQLENRLANVSQGNVDPSIQAQIDELLADIADLVAQFNG
jgi:hypothetical protein